MGLNTKLKAHLVHLVTICRNAVKQLPKACHHSPSKLAEVSKLLCGLINSLALDQAFSSSAWTLLEGHCQKFFLLLAHLQRWLPLTLPLQREKVADVVLELSRPHTFILRVKSRLSWQVILVAYRFGIPGMSFVWIQ